MPGTDEITIHQGEDLILAFTMDPVEDITGWTIELNVKGDALVITSAAAVIVSGPLGTFTVALSDAVTDALVAASYLYDVWRTDSGSERILARGIFRVLSVARVV